LVYELDPKTRRIVQEAVGKLENRVRLILFTGDRAGCLTCSDAEDMVSQVAELSPRIEVVKGLSLGSEEARRLGVDKHPAIVVHGVKEYRVRFYGVPLGLETRPFVETLVDASTGRPALSSYTLKRLQSSAAPLHIEAFTTPVCTHCPAMVRSASKMAMVNERITTDVLNALEFRELAMKYRISAVPHVVINGRTRVIGSVPESKFVDKVVEAAR